MKLAEINLPSKPNQLAGGPKGIIRMREQRHLNQSLVNFRRFSTNC